MSVISRYQGRGSRGAAACIAGAGLALALAPPAIAQEGEGGIECPSPGDIVVADPQAFPPGNGGGVIHVDPATGNRSTVSSNTSPIGPVNFVNPWNLAIESRVLKNERDCESLLVVDAGDPNVDDGRVIRVDPLTGEREIVTENLGGNGPPLVDPVGIAVESDGNLLVVDTTAFSTGAVFRVDPDTGVRSVLSQNLGVPPYFGDPGDIAIDPSGDAVVIDRDGLVGMQSGSAMRIDPSTGLRRTISEVGNPGGNPNFLDPQGLHVDDALLVADANAFANQNGGVILVNKASGARTRVSASLAPNGPVGFTDPADIAKSRFDFTGLAYVTDPTNFGGTGGVISVSTLNGARTTVSENTAPLGGPDFEEPWGIRVYGLTATVQKLDVGDIKRPGGPRASAAKGGARIRYRLSAKARAVFTIARRLKGRAGDFRCVRPSAANAERPSCVRYVRVGRLVQKGRQGANRVRFAGRVRGKALRQGAYRMTLVAVAANGDRSEAVSMKFRIVR